MICAGLVTSLGSIQALSALVKLLIEIFPEYSPAMPRKADKPEGGEPKQQLNVRVPQAVHDYVRKREQDTVVSRSLHVLAALISFECVSEATRLTMLQCARRVSRGECSWEALKEATESATLPEEKTVRRALELLVQRIEKEQQARRPA